MKVYELKAMKRGWFVGNFEPTLYNTEQCEVAVKEYSAGEYEEKHYHKIATEITVIVKGVVKMHGESFGEGKIIVTEPNDVTDFYAEEDTVLCVVKIPGATNDKYIVNLEE